MDSKSSHETHIECAGTKRKAEEITRNAGRKRPPSHQGWEKRFGKVQMCDICNRRAPDFLLRCQVCPFYVCKACVFANQLEGDGKHFVDIAETDWSPIIPIIKEYPALKGTVKKPRAPARYQPSSPATTSSSVSASPSPGHQLRLPSLRNLFPPEFFQPPTSATMPRRQGDEDEDDDYMPDEEYMPRSKRHKSLTQSTSQEEPSTTDSQHSGPQGDFELDEAYTAASYRPNPRRSATVAYDRISQTSRTSRQPHRVEEQQQERLHAQQAGTSRTSHQSQPAEEQPTSRSRVTSEVSRTSRHVHLARPQQQGRRRAPQSQIASNVPVRPSPLSNMSLLRDFQPPQTELTAASGRPVRAAISRTLDRMSRLTQAGSSSAALNPADEDFGSGAPGRPARPPLSREQQRKQDHIMVLYRSIFDSKLKEFPTLMAFEPIPDTWEGPSPRASPAPPAASPNTPQSLNLSISDRAEFDVFHQQSRSSTLRMQTPYGGSALPTPPRGYESYSFQNYPHTQPRLTSASGNEHSNYLSSDVFGQAVPSLRTTPKYHPTNEMTPEELQRYHNDRRLFVKMKAAWVDNEKVLRLRKKEGDQNALQTLWDVAQVFRARNPLNPNAESIKWFVELRDRILRPRSRDQRLSTPADEEGGHDNLGDLVNAGNSVVEEEAEPEPEPMDVDEPEPGEEEMPEANNDDDDDEFVDVDFDELGPAFRMLQQMEQQQRDHARQALQQLEQEQEQQPLETSVSPKGSKGGLGINDLLN